MHFSLRAIVLIFFTMRLNSIVYYNNFWATAVNATHTVGIEPATFSLYVYQYKLRAQQFLATSKLFTTIANDYHPYLMAGLGLSSVNLSQYDASSQDTGSANFTPTFEDNTQIKFTYSLGMGLEKAIDEHVCLGLGYRFTSLGSAASVLVGPYPSVPTTPTL